ncbi:unnamed protein product [Acanthoscelides obtectus]|uniref:MADF domain-containing protein n=1 Tax=Acanthoscelides obtectus TaxID=200917 RepID=A0A9P0JI04_ACAOB|nr:unnamed protein product [Acanthoscelides obtectus]CAK1661365.1 hypothetical protein AOBTE_LOCUS22578 [Acanthoscelides obtectus]
MWEQLEDKGLLKGMDEKQLKNKIKNLKDVFRQELAKIERSKKSGCGTEDIYTPKLTWFEAAHFFAEVLSTRHSNSNLTLPSTQNISEEISNSQIEQRDDEEPDTQPKEQNIKPSEGMGPPKSKKRVRKQADPEIGDAISQLNKIAENVSEGKPYDEFGKYVAGELRQLPQREAILLQQEIQNSITRVKLMCLGNDNQLNKRAPSSANFFTVILPQ